MIVAVALAAAFIVGLAGGFLIHAGSTPVHASHLAARYFDLWQDQTDQHRQTREQMERLAVAWEQQAEASAEDYPDWAAAAEQCAVELREELA